MRAGLFSIMFLASCSLEPIDLTGKKCERTCPGDYLCVDGACARAASTVTDGGAVEDYLVLTVSEDSEDAFWEGDRELLWEEEGGVAVFVGSGNGTLATGLRFALPLPRGTRVLEAQLELWRLIGGAPEDGTMRTQVWNSIEVPPFDGSHVHPPEFHASGGLSDSIGGWEADWGTMNSPNLAALVDPLLQREDWAEGSAIGFVISAENFPADTWAGFEDSAANDGHAPKLKLRILKY